MKKSLLATTALAALGAVAVAGPAAAAERISVGVGGYMEQWFGYADNDENVAANSSGFDQQTDAEIHFQGSTTLDNGITVGVNVQLEGESQGAGDTIDEQYIFVSGSFGRFLIGEENAAPYQMHYGIPSEGAGIDEGDSNGWIAGIQGALVRTSTTTAGDNDSGKITYFSPRFSGFQVGASYTPSHRQDIDGTAGIEADGVSDDGFAVAANFDQSFGDARVRVSGGYQDYGKENATNTDGGDAMSFGLRVGFAGFTVSGAYGAFDIGLNDVESYGVGLHYASGPFGVSAAWIGGENDNGDIDQNVFELGGRYSLGPGVDVKGSFFYGEREAAGVDAADGIAFVGGLDLAF